MKRIHIHLSVEDLQDSIRFYTVLFGSEPAVEKDDYAKWSMDDPSVNFAISNKGACQRGLDHVGIQAENDDELQELHIRLSDANYATMEQKRAKCCYAESDKHWASDPDGIKWEVFHTVREVEVYGNDRAEDLSIQQTTS